MVDTTAIS